MRWLANYVARFCPYYEDANGVNDFLRHVREDRQIFYYGSDLHCYEDLVDADNLFRHLSVITGLSITREYFTGGFHCSC